MYKEHKITNDDRNPICMAIPLASKDNAVHVGDELRLVKQNFSEKELYLDFLCDGMLADLDVGYAISKRCKSTKFDLHLMPFSFGNVRHVNEKLRNHNKNIVIHETSLGTDYAPKYKNKEHYIDLIDKTNLNGGNTGYHFLCDFDSIVCFLPWDEVAYHASSMFYNSKSIGVERVVTEEAGVDAIYNQAKLIASLMYLEGIPLHRVITHFAAGYARRLPIRDNEGHIMYNADGDFEYYSKSCPDRLIHGQFGGLLAFYQVIVNLLKTGDLFLNALKSLKEEIKIEDKKELARIQLSRTEDIHALVKVKKF